MKHRLLAGAITGLMLGTSAFAQSPSDQQRTNAPSAQSSSPKASPSPSTTQNTQGGSSNAQQLPTNATADSPRPQAQSNQPAAAPQPRSDGNTANPQAQQPSQQPSQAQSAQQPGSSSQPSQAQTNTAPPANNQSTRTQPTSGPANATNNAANTGAAQPSTNTAAQPSNTQTSAAQPRTNVNVSANLTESQRTRVSTSISRLNARPVTNVNFSLSVGTVVPRNVRFQPLPADVVEVMPQYRGYNFIVVREDIVIIEPSTYKIVDVLPRGGRSTAAAPAPRKSTFSDSERDAVRKHARSSRMEQHSNRTEPRTTGSAASTRIRVGDRLPDSVVIRSFPDGVYRESPRLREYRYIERDDRTYIIEPGARRIIEEIED
ncbi:hypothetical protein CQ14_19225 [Bradyrhizobium lablabi]|uniref:DUF1236 domain-containing protein n=1 Tax=Bradyrhizobium lablabi TaxID=722472 RepID=A0A0R3MFI5_9BRAD|nr:DUF1236 domain-containing protein [Bradyrhizobium lablabi]KRR19015.1 hypothetical protein CQ14_19225 [Bradyrhizobium lablabi]